MLIPINCHLFLDDSEIEESFVRASGPGGQNVNKVASAVQLRFDVRRSPSLPGPVRAALLALSDARLDKQGVLTITARRVREQARNRADARARLADMCCEASQRLAPALGQGPHLLLLQVRGVEHDQLGEFLRRHRGDDFTPKPTLGQQR